MEGLIDKLLDVYEVSSDGSNEPTGSGSMSINKCFKACIYRAANDDENEKMEMSTVRTFLKILSSNRPEGAYVIGTSLALPYCGIL